LNQTSTKAARFALKAVVLAAACLWGSHAAALGLGRLAVQSSLGETLKPKSTSPASAQKKPLH
jgi:pilus assembly protein FimV